MCGGGAVRHPGVVGIFFKQKTAYEIKECDWSSDVVLFQSGPRSMEQIQHFSEAITRFLLERDAKIIVVACNAASAAALKYLRKKFLDVPFVGMEPAVKPAAEHTQTGKVGVL